MPSLRQTSATVTPLSACCNANTICDSVNLDFFMAIVRLPSCHNCPLFSILFWPGFKGGGQTLECCWTTSFGVRPDKELYGRKPLYSSLNNRIFSFASSSERNQLTFRHSSRKLPLNDSMNGLSVGFPGREKSSVT